MKKIVGLVIRFDNIKFLEIVFFLFFHKYKQDLRVLICKRFKSIQFLRSSRMLTGVKRPYLVMQGRRRENGQRADGSTGLQGTANSLGEPLKGSQQ